MRTILDMNNKAAARFFFKPCNYFSLSLPSYFQFDRLLTRIRELIKEENLRSLYIRDCHPRTFQDINYPIIYNKDGEYAWRKFQIIHPFIYTEIVQILTQIDNWHYVTHRIKQFRNRRVICTSMLPAPTSKLTKNEQDIFNWAGNFTSETVRRSLRYKYMFTTDLTNCYDSLSFHLLPQALYDGVASDNVEGDPPLVGYQIQTLLQDMLYGRSCGFPQGSVLMDFFAEIILGYIDSLLSNRLDENLDVYILRYRDDYRIFTNDITTARYVMKVLVELFAEFGLKINLSKTRLTSDVIKHAFKPDHLAWQTIHPLIFGETKISTLKSLLLIRDFGRRYPNCGSLKNALGTLYQEDVYESGCHDDIWQIAGVLTDIMLTNTGVWPHCVAILSKYIDSHDAINATDIVRHIRKKFMDIPHTEYLDIWLQRLSVKEDPHCVYDSMLCQSLFNQGAQIWNSDWLGMYTNLHDSDIIAYDEILNMPSAIPSSEVALFITSHSSGEQ